MKRKISTIIITGIILCITCATLITVNASPTTHFTGTLEFMYGSWVKIEGNWFYSQTLIAEVETPSGDTFSLTYTDIETAGRTNSKWKQFYSEPVESVWDFGDEDYIFDASGRVIGASYWVFPPGHDGSHTPAYIVSKGVFSINGGTWDGDAIIGGQADWLYKLDMEEYLAHDGTADDPVPLIGSIKGSIQLDN